MADGGVNQTVNDISTENYNVEIIENKNILLSNG